MRGLSSAAAAVLILMSCQAKDAPPRRVPVGVDSEMVIANAGLQTPESMLHDPLTDYYYVANINGQPADADDNGFISRIDDRGQVLELKWIDGAADSVTLNAPKGMAVVGDYLYVTDITVIRRFDRRTGRPRGEFPIAGATFLNDIAAGPDESVYFTDSGLKAGAQGLEPSGTYAVYQMMPDGSVETLLKGPELGNPNGIALAGDTVWVVGYGSGELYRVADGNRADVVKLPKGGLDGLVIAFGDFFISSWEAEAIYRGRPGSFREAIRGLKAPADIGHDLWRNKLLVPLFNDNEVRIIPLAQ